MQRLILLCLLLNPWVVLAQKEISGFQNCVYSPPTGVNGLTHVDIKFNYRLSKTHGDLYLEYNATYQGNLEVQYKGKRYTGYGGDWNTQDGLPGIRNVRCKDAKIRVTVVGPGVNITRDIQLYELNVDGTSFVTNFKNEDVTGFKVLVNTGALSVSYDNLDPVFAAIEKKENELANKNKYEGYLKEADRYMQAGNFSEAKKALRNADSYSNGDGKAKDKLKELEEKEGLANNKKKADDLIREAEKKMAAKDYSGAKETLQKAKELDPSNGKVDDKIAAADRAEKDGTDKKETDTKTALSRDTDFWGEKKKNTTGNTTAPEKTNEQIMAETRENLEKKDQQFWAEKEALQRKIDRDANLSTQSFYAAERLSNAQADVKAYSHLSGNHKTLQELEEEFEEKISNIRRKISEETEAKNDKLRADANYLWRDGNANDKAFGELAVGLGNIINGIGEEKKKREARERLEKEKAAYEKKMEQEIAAQQKKLLLEIRNSFLSSFPDGGVPLSSHKVGTSQLYFFSYIFDPKTIESQNPVIYLTNIFPVSQYGDGTWPFKNNIVNEIKQKAPAGTVTLIGYYASEATITETRNSFLAMAAKGSFDVKEINYKGKSSASGGTTNNYWGSENNKTNKTTRSTDFWGEPKKPAADSSDIKKPVKKGFWD